MKKLIFVLFLTTACGTKIENSHNKSKGHCYIGDREDFLTQINCQMAGGKFETYNEKPWFKF